jgi:hypothetical protein
MSCGICGEQSATAAGFLRVLGIPFQLAFHRMLHTHLSSEADKIGPLMTGAPSGLFLIPLHAKRLIIMLFNTNVIKTMVYKSHSPSRGRSLDYRRKPRNRKIRYFFHIQKCLNKELRLTEESADVWEKVIGTTHCLPRIGCVYSAYSYNSVQRVIVITCSSTCCMKANRDSSNLRDIAFPSAWLEISVTSFRFTLLIFYWDTTSINIWQLTLMPFIITICYS